MITELKWTLAAIVLVMFCFTLGQMNRDNRVAECKIAALAMNRTPAEIENLCK